MGLSQSAVILDTVFDSISPEQPAFYASISELHALTAETIKSKQTLLAARDELIEHGLIIVVRQCDESVGKGHGFFGGTAKRCPSPRHSSWRICSSAKKVGTVSTASPAFPTSNAHNPAVAGSRVQIPPPQPTFCRGVSGIRDPECGWEVLQSAPRQSGVAGSKAAGDGAAARSVGSQTGQENGGEFQECHHGGMINPHQSPWRPARPKK